MKLRSRSLAFLLGLFLGVAGSAVAQRLIGGDGFLLGWDVTLNGEVICSDPFVWSGTREIACD